jgi:hypothetical protein
MEKQATWPRRPRPARSWQTLGRKAVASIRAGSNNPAMDSRAAQDLPRPLEGQSLRLAGQGVATDYARSLLESLGARAGAVAGPDDPHPALAWAGSGLMALTGNSNGPAQMCPVPLASCADGAMAALRCIAPEDMAAALPSGSALLGERAAIAGLRRGGSASPGGGCRLLEAADGWLAVSLARDDDWSLVPAWLEIDAGGSWDDVASATATRGVDQLVERARLLGLAACASAMPGATVLPWCTVTHHGTARLPGKSDASPRVLELASLWAGPLCSHLLQAIGARVIKVESLSRPDGARSGPPAFYDLLNGGKRSVALDLATGGIDRLAELLDWADIVIEGSRPRALRQLGVIAEDWVTRRPGLTWVSITGYGRGEPEGNWTAFGDDAGVAAGLSALMHAVTGLPLICGDAIADPLAGMHAALAALASHRSGGGRLLSLPLRDVAAHCAAHALPACGADLGERWREWTSVARARGLEDALPVARTAAVPARPLGADSDSALAGWNQAC